VPAAETVAQAAEDFLEQTWFMTLLNSRYMIEVNRESARFYRVMDGGMRVDPPFAVVTVSPEGRVAILEMHVAYMDAVGQYDLIPAAEAWALVSDPAAQARISVQVTPAVDGNPPVWGRRYKAGETVRITAPLTIYAGPTPYIRVNGLSIHGTTAQLTSLANAYQVLQQATMDTRTPIQIWGMVGPDGSTLELEGYAEVRQPGMWVGVLRRDGETGILTTDDGLTLELPDLPDDLPDGLRVFVEGESANNRLEWTVIQQAVEGGPGPGLSLEVIIDQVELGYLAPDGLMLRQNGINDFALQSLQPVWRFSGFTAAGDAVSIYVQAVK
jgi:hypothetical protein